MAALQAAAGSRTSRTSRHHQHPWRGRSAAAGSRLLRVRRGPQGAAAAGPALLGARARRFHLRALLRGREAARPAARGARRDAAEPRGSTAMSTMTTRPRTGARRSAGAARRRPAPRARAAPLRLTSRLSGAPPSTSAIPFAATIIDNIRSDRPRFDQGNAARRTVAGRLGADLSSPATRSASSPRNDPGRGRSPARSDWPVRRRAAVREGARRRRWRQRSTRCSRSPLATPRFLDHWAKLSGAAELERLTRRRSTSRRAPPSFEPTTSSTSSGASRSPGVDAADLRRRAAAAAAAPLLASHPACSALAGRSASDRGTGPLRLHGEARARGRFRHISPTRAEPDTTIPGLHPGQPAFPPARRRQADHHDRRRHRRRPVSAPSCRSARRAARAGKSWLVLRRAQLPHRLPLPDRMAGLAEGRRARPGWTSPSRATARPRPTSSTGMLEQARDIYAWLEEGAHVYVCGDAARMAPDVHEALVSIVARKAALRARRRPRTMSRGLQRDHRYQRDVY